MIPQRYVSPVSPEVIDADPLIRYSFQADGDFNLIHESSPKARDAFRIAPLCIAAAAQMAQEAGFPPIERIVATSPHSQFMIFSMNAPKASPPGPRVFGLSTDPSVTLDDAINFIKTLV